MIFSIQKIFSQRLVFSKVNLTFQKKKSKKDKVIKKYIQSFPSEYFRKIINYKIYHIKIFV